MIIQPDDDRTVEETAEEAVWATFGRRLEQQGDDEGVFYLRHLVKAELESSIERGPYRTLRFDLSQRMSDYASSYNAITGERLSWLFDALREAPEADEAADPPDAAACLAVAREVASPPDGAELVVSDFEDQGGETAFVARWAHVHEGVPVEGDYIQVLVNPGTERAFAHHRKWHEIDPDPSER